MSAKDLLNTLENILKKVEKDSNTYRVLVSNKKAHYLHMNLKDVKKEARIQLRAHLGIGNNKALPKEIETVITREVPKFVKKVYDYVKTREIKQTKGIMIKGEVKGNSENFTALFAMHNDRPRLSIFNRIKRIKQIYQRPFIKELNKVLSSDKQMGVGGGSAFLDIGHDVDSTVSSQRQLSATQELLSFSSKAPPVVQQFINEIIQGITSNIEIIEKKNEQILRVSLESARGNRASMTKGEVSDLNASLLTVISKLQTQDWIELGSSDSYLQRADKKIRKEFFSEITPTKNVRIKKTSTKIKLPSKGKKQGQTKRSKTVVGSTIPPVKTLATQKNKNKTSDTDPMRLFGVINAKLPETVRKNMQLPALENRTGAFADSVHLTDIIATKQGFPSIGYTYDKNPYQVFEMGAGDQRWATTQRDPRTIINKSIREIAAEFAVGRFYTRRV